MKHKSTSNDSNIQMLEAHAIQNIINSVAQQNRILKSIPGCEGAIESNKKCITGLRKLLKALKLKHSTAVESVNPCKTCIFQRECISTAKNNPDFAIHCEHLIFSRRMNELLEEDPDGGVVYNTRLLDITKTQETVNKAFNLN